MPTKIEWATETWNPVTGCTPISEGCKNCYAERMAYRLAHIEGSGYGNGVDSPNPTGAFKVTLRPERMDKPLSWKKPRRIFVCSMGDLFHKDVPFPFILKIWDIVRDAPQHTFIFLTKRPVNMFKFTRWLSDPDDVVGTPWPRNCWIGVTAENQQEANARIPMLLKIPAAVHFVSVEPMLGPVYLGDVAAYPRWSDGLDWVVCGGETGPGARPMNPEWARALRNQCQNAGVPFFFKQWGEWVPYAKCDPIKKEGIKFGVGPCSDWIIDENGTCNRAYCEQRPGRYAWNWYAREEKEWGQGYCSALVGKHIAGRLLDGKEWNEYPEVK